MKREALELSRKEEMDGASILERVATHMMIIQLNRVLEDEWGGLSRLESKYIAKQTISQGMSVQQTSNVVK